jgi:hypothetical protein
MSLESDGGMILTGENRRTERKTCPSATLSTTNPTWIVLGANSDLRVGRPKTNHLSHGTALSPGINQPIVRLVAHLCLVATSWVYSVSPSHKET